MNAEIVQIDRAFALWLWLCPPHTARREAQGYQIKVRKEPPHPLPCDDCRWGEPTTIPTIPNQGASDADR